MGLHLRAKLEVSSVILTGFTQGVVILPPPPISKRTPKKPTQIRVKWKYPKNTLNNYFHINNYNLTHFLLQKLHSEIFRNIARISDMKG